MLLTQCLHEKKELVGINPLTLYIVAPRARFELATKGLTVLCATAAPPGNCGCVVTSQHWRVYYKWLVDGSIGKREKFLLKLWGN